MTLGELAATLPKLIGVPEVTLQDLVIVICTGKVLVAVSACAVEINADARQNKMNLIGVFIVLTSTQVLFFPSKTITYEDGVPDITVG